MLPLEYYRRLANQKMALKMMNNRKLAEGWMQEARRGQIMHFGTISGLEWLDVTEEWMDFLCWWTAWGRRIDVGENGPFPFYKAKMP